MIGYEKKGFYFVLKKTHVFVKRHELKKLIGLDAYDYFSERIVFKTFFTEVLP